MADPAAAGYSDQSDNRVPTNDMTPLNMQPEPADTNVEHTVPATALASGHDTNIPLDDSPESLDQAISQGDDRDRIDPHHSVERVIITDKEREIHGED